MGFGKCACGFQRLRVEKLPSEAEWDLLGADGQTHWPWVNEGTPQRRRL